MFPRQQNIQIAIIVVISPSDITMSKIRYISSNIGENATVIAIDFAHCMALVHCTQV